MKTRVLMRRYAEAFFKVIEQDGLEEGYRAFSTFSGILKDSPELPQFLLNPGVRRNKKEEIINKIFQEFPKNRLREFVLLLLKKTRFRFFPEICEELEILYKKAKSIVAVSTVSAVPLLPKEREMVREKISEIVQGTVELEEKVDPKIIGGILIYFEGKLFDASLKTRIRNFQEKLLTLNTELLATIQVPPMPIS